MRQAALPGRGPTPWPPSPPRPRPSQRPGAGSGGRARKVCPLPRTEVCRAAASATPPWPARAPGTARRPAPIRELPRTQVQAEPRGLQSPVHHVQPDGDLGQLDGRLVEVDAVAVMQGDVRLDPLQGQSTLLRFEPITCLFLAQPQIQGGELVDGLVEERARAKRRLADPPAGAPRQR